MRPIGNWVAISTSLLMLACGDEGVNSNAHAVVETPLAFSRGRLVEDDSRTLDGTIEALGFGAEDRVVALTATSIVTLGDAVISRPTSLEGPVRIMPRSRGGAWIAGGEASFSLVDGVLASVFPPEAAGRIDDIVDLPLGASRGVWWLSAGELIERRRGLERVVATGVDGFALSFEDRLLRKEGSSFLLAADFSLSRLPSGIGRVQQIAASRVALYLLTSRGVTRVSNDTSVLYTSERPLSDLRATVADDTVWLRSGDDALRLQAGVWTLFDSVLANAQTFQPLHGGETWVAKGSRLQRFVDEGEHWR